MSAHKKLPCAEITIPLRYYRCCPARASASRKRGRTAQLSPKTPPILTSTSPLPRPRPEHRLQHKSAVPYLSIVAPSALGSSITCCEAHVCWRDFGCHSAFTLAIWLPRIAAVRYHPLDGNTHCRRLAAYFLVSQRLTIDRELSDFSTLDGHSQLGLNEASRFGLDDFQLVQPAASTSARTHSRLCIFPQLIRLCCDSATCNTFPES
ncbi:hypothetical protein VTL71DRAFT_9150 [Oculimacula yallundae]|uniref:Uncharacterized protein n=1 Tax=Oculimacula yallundae TaxID=86028 RepID=A0ABR4BU08_9HELO